MAELSWFQRTYWRSFAKPAEHRSLFRFLLDHPIQSVLEIGITNGLRMKQVLELHRLTPGAAQLRYAAVDLFESAPISEAHLKLKDVHRMLAERHVKANLIPGDVSSALPRVVKTIMPSDLIIIDRGWGLESSEGESLQAWLPKLRHAASTIFVRSYPNQPLVALDLEASEPAFLSRAA
jgi:hypothetical protein